MDIGVDRLRGLSEEGPESQAAAVGQKCMAFSAPSVIAEHGEVEELSRLVFEHAEVRQRGTADLPTAFDVSEWPELDLHDQHLCSLRTSLRRRPIHPAKAAWCARSQASCIA